MSPYAILDTCFLRAQFNSVQSIQILGTIGLFSQSTLDTIVAQDAAILEFLEPLVASKQVFVLKQVAEEIQGFRNAFDKKMDCLSVSSDWNRFDLSNLYRYREELIAFHERLKHLEPSKNITAVQREREQDYSALTREYVARFPLIRKPVHKHIIARRTDERIISLAFALAHTTDTYVLTRDRPLINTIKELGIQFIWDADFSLPAHNVYVPSFHFDVQDPSWIKIYNAQYAISNQRFYAKRNAGSPSKKGAYSPAK